MWSPYFFTIPSQPLVHFSFFGYGLGWEIECPNPLNPSQGYTRSDRVVAYHTGAAVGASSVLAVAPDCRDMKWTLYKNGNRMPSGDESSLQRSGEDESADNAAALHTEPTSGKDVLQVVLSEREIGSADPGVKPKHPVQGPVKGIVVSMVTNVRSVNLEKEAQAIIDAFSVLSGRLY